MRIALIASECVPFVKTGGLADVTGALGGALSALGHEVKVFVPLYRRIDRNSHGLKASLDLGRLQADCPTPFSFSAWYSRLPGSDAMVHFIDDPESFDLAYIYGEGTREAHRFIRFQHAVLRVMQQYHWAPDIIHVNDWQTALIPGLLQTYYRWDELFVNTKTVLGLHNLAYRGIFDLSVARDTGLPEEHGLPMGPGEFHGGFAFLKHGLASADRIVTVSPTYAEEIRTPAYGEGLDGLLRERGDDLSGILNGIDPTVWNPATDRHLAANYDLGTLARKGENKRALQARMGLPVDDTIPVMGIVSRFAYQKGFDLFSSFLEGFLATHPVQLAILGSGDAGVQGYFEHVARLFPNQLALETGYHEPLAHQIEAGADFFLMPSRYEPCGLNQMYSLAYGTPPIVRRTGGLADTVVDVHAEPGAGNGFSFDDFTPDALLDAMQRACALYQDHDAYRAMQERGMRRDFSWTEQTLRYQALYSDLCKK